MNQGEVKIGIGRKIAGFALGVLLALFAPLSLIVEFFSPMAMVLLLPSVALIALHRWSGPASAFCSAVLMMAMSALYGGGALLAVALFLLVLPPMLLLRMQDRPFFSQLKFSIGAFGVGVLAAVAMIFFNFGGNLIERVLGQFPDLVRSLPEEYVAPMLEYVSTALGRTLTPDAFFELYDGMMRELIPVYQMLLPQRLFSGALLSALVCVWLSNRMRAKRGIAASGSFVPLRGWALPSSTTCGLLFLLLVSWLLTLTKLSGAQTLCYAVYGIANVSFGAQAMGSAARRLRMTRLRLGSRRAALIAIGLLGMFILPDALMVYGLASAIFGSRGAIIQRRQNQNDGGRFGGEDE